MGYAFLAGAIAAEVVATISMKYSESFSRLGPSLVTLTGYVVSFALLARALRTLPIGTSYAIWSGIGTAAVASLGLLLFGEHLGPAKIAGILLIVGGVVVLNLGGAH
ncbi:DMT family transporter [Streptomyces sp. NPDC052040]|uniref:DMT family transporter n=1 Tax=unclassified Streptomyces TaxID=2593676 RepID=UPI0037CE6727